MAKYVTTDRVRPVLPRYRFCRLRAPLSLLLLRLRLRLRISRDLQFNWPAAA